MSDFHEHHRQLRRGGDDRPVNLLRVGPILHDWIHKHPAEARELGWIVSQYENPEDIIVTIPDSVVSKPVTKRKKAATPEERRARKQFNIATPQGEDQIIPELVQAGREAWGDELGWSESVPAHYVVVAAFTKALQ